MAFVPNQRRRWFGLFYLLTAVGLLTWGLAWLSPLLRGWLFIAYWSGCFLSALLALIIAWLDLRAIRRHARAEQRELLNQALTRFGHEAQRRAAESDTPSTHPTKPPHPENHV